MRLLLDTHVVLWWLMDDPELGSEARGEIAEAEPAVISVASAWEIEMKRGLGRLEAPDDLEDQLLRHRFSVLPVHLAHAVKAGRLPQLHRDPFDRMLVSQAQVEDLTIVTRDPQIRQYDVSILAT